jgi:sulfoxide reductase heme-binding subunit YedZ
MAIFHQSVIGLNVHLRGRPWLYFVDQRGKLRGDLFGFSNYTGAIAALVFMLRLAISNDLSLRRLGTQRWKSLQRWTYAAVALTFAHGVAYQRIEKRYIGLEVVVWATMVVVCTVQIVGFLT